MQARRQSGLTLVEMLAVLLVLTMLASIAISSTEGLIDKGRHETSIRGLEELETAILGDPQLRDGNSSLIPNGYASDVGRLPVARGGDPLTQLEDLWKQGTAPAWSTRETPQGDDEVSMAAGWKGPYLNLPLGASDLRDGWHKPFVLLKAGPPVAPVVDGDPVEILQTLGSDSAAGGEGYAADLPPIDVASGHKASLSGYVHLGTVPTAAVARDIVVRVYGPDGSAVPKPVKTLDQVVLTLPAGSPGPIAYTFDAVANGGKGPLVKGSRIVRAYLVSPPVAPAFEDPIPTIHRSAPLRVSIDGRPKDLTLLVYPKP